MTQDNALRHVIHASTLVATQCNEEVHMDPILAFPRVRSLTTFIFVMQSTLSHPDYVHIPGQGFFQDLHQGGGGKCDDCGIERGKEL